MNNAINFQQKFNGVLQKHAPANISMAREISDLLNLSMDSTYRRLRNETDYTINEVATICMHFKIPFESLLQEESSLVTFKVNILNNDIDSYLKYLENILLNIEKLSHFEETNIIIAAEDIPVFYHFIEPKLMQFKMIYWLKSLMNVTDFQYSHFESIVIPEKIIQTAMQINNFYEKIDSTEIWTNETILSTLKQIKFYWDAGFFNKPETAYDILSDFETIIKNIQRNAETGFKFSKAGNMSKAKFQFYVSDVMIGTNSILSKTNNFSATYISYSTFNFMQTTNESFNTQNEQWLNNILSKSTLLSGVSEKQRNQFFKNVLRQIQEMRVYFETS